MAGIFQNFRDLKNAKAEELLLKVLSDNCKNRHVVDITNFTHDLLKAEMGN